MTFAVSLLLAWLSVESTPPKTEVRPACSQWKGTISGNDPSVAVTATLCDVGENRVRGTLVWTSKVSGSSTRTLVGAWSRERRALTLRDVKLTGTPNGNWRFCKVDRYDLSADGNARVSGTYHSSACSDDATITLERVR